MRSILEEFAYESLSSKRFVYNSHTEYCDMINLVSVIEEKLVAQLSGELKELFQKYIDAQNELAQLSAVSKLIQGFKQGLLMTAEAFVNGEDLIV